MLQERGFYTISLEGGKEIPIRFSTWTLMRFCELKGNLSLNNLFNTIGGDGATLKDFILLVKAGAECASQEKGGDFSPSEIEVCKWIDEMGGMSGDKFKDLIDVMAKSMEGQESKKKLKVAK